LQDLLLSQVLPPYLHLQQIPLYIYLKCTTKRLDKKLPIDGYHISLKSDLRPVLGLTRIPIYLLARLIEMK